MRFQSEASVFKFLRRSADRALVTEQLPKNTRVVSFPLIRKSMIARFILAEDGNLTFNSFTICESPLR